MSVKFQYHTLKHIKKIDKKNKSEEVDREISLRLLCILQWSLLS